jgi:hypothetical protein
VSDQVLLPAAALADLATYVGRARRVDPDGAVRLVGAGSALAVYVSPVHGGGGPTVLGLRVLPLAEPSDVDVTVALAAVTDRLAHLTPAVTAPADEPVALAVPPVQVTDAGWAGVSPPRSGWQDAGVVSREVLDDVVRGGAREIADGAPEGSGAHAVARLRALVWGRNVPGVAGLPGGAAFAADALGFVGPGTDEVAVLERGTWRRLSTPRGHVLARPSLL